MTTFLPDLQRHFVREGVIPAMFASNWFMTLFASCDTLPLGTVEFLWDHFLVGGWKVIMRAILVILSKLQSDFIRYEFATIVELLHHLPLDHVPKEALVDEGKRSFKVTRRVLRMIEAHWEDGGP
jgi:hypothetical protein